MENKYLVQTNICTNKCLAFSCVASLRNNFLEISLPHTLANALSVEGLNRVGFNDGSGGDCFVYYFFRSQRM